MDLNRDDEGFVDLINPCSICNATEASHEVYKKIDNLLAPLIPLSCNDCLHHITEHEHLYSEELE